LQAGDVVMTGTCVVPVPVKPGDAVVADFGAFGRVSARFK
jgi:2-keto-4-pentenoate hydratase